MRRREGWRDYRDWGMPVRKTYAGRLFRAMVSVELGAGAR